MNRRRIAGLVMLVTAWGWACHDAPGPWEPVGEEVPAGARQLTFSPGDDRSPSWSLGGDSILYVAEGYGDLARSSGVLVSIHREGGPVTSVFPLLQPPRATAPAVLAPAVEPGTGRIAYAQVLPVQGVCDAPSTSCDAADSVPGPPTLQSGRIRVRAPGSTTPADQDPTLSIAFDGVEFDHTRQPFNLTGVWVTRLHPFQLRYNELGRLPVHPSWAPQGGSLVWSDGLQLLVWRPGDAGATPVAGTEEATSPAWSPEGSLIAFTRLDRGPELRTTCQRFQPGKTGPVLVCVEERTQWPIGRAVVAVIPAGGGEALDLLEGTDPAWSPDGQWVYVARADGIWKAAATGGVFVRIEGTEGGFEPAASPDGRELAFTRLDAAGKGDIWVVPVP